MNDPILYTEIVPGGGMWSAVVRRHTTLRITDRTGGANVGFIAYNADQLLERLNLPDTLKALHTAKLTRGHVLMSDMGRALFSITADNLGWHDPLGGHGHAALVERKYGVATYQEKRNGWYRNAHDDFLIELAKHGLSRRDLMANVNFFSRLDVDDDGQMQFVKNHSHAGAAFELRAEMNVLVVLNTCQHPLDPNPEYAPKPVVLAVLKSAAPEADDFCRLFRPECSRSLELSERYFAGI